MAGTGPSHGTPSPVLPVDQKERMEKRSRLQPLARAVLRTQCDHRLVALARGQGRRVRGDRPPLPAGPGGVRRRLRSARRRGRRPGELRSRLGRAAGNDPEMHLKAWLYTIVRNRALNARRDSRARAADRADGRRPAAAGDRAHQRRARRAVAAIARCPSPSARRSCAARSRVTRTSRSRPRSAPSPGAARQLIYRARMYRQERSRGADPAAAGRGVRRARSRGAGAVPPAAPRSRALPAGPRWR